MPAAHKEEARLLPTLHMPPRKKRQAETTPTKPTAKEPKTTPPPKAPAASPPQMTELPLIVTVTQRQWKQVTITDVDIHTARDGDDGWDLTRHMVDILAKIFPWWTKEAKEHPLNGLLIKMVYMNKPQGGKFSMLTGRTDKIFAKYNSLITWLHQAPHPTPT